MRDPRRIQIDVNLECELDGDPIRIFSDTDARIVCELPNSKSLFRLRKLASEAISLRHAKDLFSLTGQTVEVLVAGESIGRFGGQSSRWLLKRFGLPATDLRFWEIAKLWFRRD